MNIILAVVNSKCKIDNDCPIENTICVSTSYEIFSSCMCKLGYVASTDKYSCNLCLYLYNN